jgi:hypothetical protein
MRIYLIVIIILALSFYNPIKDIINDFIDHWKSQNPPSINPILSGFTEIGFHDTGHTIIPDVTSDYDKFLDLSEKNIIKLISSTHPVYSHFDPAD